MKHVTTRRLPKIPAVCLLPVQPLGLAPVGTIEPPPAPVAKDRTLHGDLGNWQVGPTEILVGLLRHSLGNSVPGAGRTCSSRGNRLRGAS